ncbi:MAG: hypothetical protein HYW57_03030, partial [Ignavibacteriales bacterium]|nr:hypothetical protein [Ignavibacteriales bacterium]
KREPRVLAAGSLLIIVGIALLLRRLDIVSLRWDTLFWLGGLAGGGFLVADGFVRSKRGRVFWGSVLFLGSLYFVLLRFGVLLRYDFPLVPILFVVFGLSFFVLYLSDLGEVTLLIPALLFTGLGGGAILWWWEVFEWYELREILRIYWPIILVLWGTALLVRRRPDR